jgi:hypothetical protein
MTDYTNELEVGSKIYISHSRTHMISQAFRPPWQEERPFSQGTKWYITCAKKARTDSGDGRPLK